MIWGPIPFFPVEPHGAAAMGLRAVVKSKPTANRKAGKGAPWGVFKHHLITLTIHQPTDNSPSRDRHFNPGSRMEPEVRRD